MKISIIIPVYNVEKYISQMLECLLRQTIQDFEIICVDDMSTDGSVQIIEEFAQKDKRISLIKAQRKVGAGEARNIGMRKSTGDFLMFLDGDDLFEDDLLEEMYTAIHSCKCDIAIAEHDTFFGEGEYVKEQAIPAMNQYKERRSLQYAEEPFDLEKLGWEGLVYWYPVPWNRMYRRSFIEKYGLEFQNVKCSNDIYFTSMAMMLAGGIIHTKKFASLIHYRRNTSTQISFNRYPMCIYNAFSAIYGKMKEMNIWVKYAQAYYVRLFACLLSEINKCGREEWAIRFYSFLREEGLGRLGVENDEEYWRISIYIQEAFDNFFVKKYEDKWFCGSVENDMRRQLAKDGNNRTTLLDNIVCRTWKELKGFIEEKDMRPAVWGNGYCERKTVEILRDKGIQVFCITEVSQIKQKNINLLLFSTTKRLEESYIPIRKEGRELNLLNLEKYCSGDMGLDTAIEYGISEMNKRVKVSVIVPVYNVEEYLKECLDSLAHQTLNEFEVICVDDCSGDCSYEILKEYQKKDSRFIVVQNEKNMGLSSTRNNGLRNAKGKYIYFLDSDDKICPDSLEKLYEKAEENYADVVYFNCQPLFENEQLAEKFSDYRFGRSMDYPEVYAGKDLFVAFRYNWDWVSNVARIFMRKDLLEKQKLLFYPGILHEDELFTFQIMMESRRSVYMNEAFYIRRFREDSITTVKKGKQHLEGLMIVLAEIIKYWNENDLTQIQSKAIEMHVFNMYRNLTKLYLNEKSIVYEKGLECENEAARILFGLFKSLNRKDSNQKTGWEEQLQGEQHIYIYGAGQYGEQALINLKNLNFAVEGFIVSEIANNPRQKFGINIYELDELAKKEKDICVVIGVSMKYQAEILQKLSTHNFRKTVKIF